MSIKEEVVTKMVQDNYPKNRCRNQGQSQIMAVTLCRRYWQQWALSAGRSDHRKGLKINRNSSSPFTFSTVFKKLFISELIKTL